MISALRRDVINGFDEVNVARERRNRRGAEVRNAGDVHCRSYFIVDRRIETTVRVLEPRLVQRATAERRNVADDGSLIGIFQTGTATHRIQPADGPRVDGFDVVKTVTRAELVTLIDRVIDTSKEVRRIETRGNDTGGNKRASIIHGAESIVYRADCRGRNRQHGGI